MKKEEEEEDEGGKYIKKGELCHKNSLRFPPPMPRTIRLWQVPWG